MRITAVICEYNLFHAGHQRLHAAIRAYWAAQGEACTILSVMSGNYVQRGEMAILPKYLRAEAAVRGGADLVLELPYPWSGGAAEYFASGAVSLLCSLGVVDSLAFGSESGDLSGLVQVTHRLADPMYSEALHRARTSGERVSELRLRASVYADLYGEPLLQGANDLLGTEYLRALQRTDPKERVTPLAFPRTGEETASETRRRLMAGESPEGIVPHEVAEMFFGQKPISAQTVSDAILSAYRMGSPSAFAAYEGGSDGLAARICHAANSCVDLSSMLACCATKQYTHAHIRRTVWNGFFGVTRQMLRESPVWTEVLASNRRGCDLLHRLKKSSSCIVLTKPSHYKRYTDPAFLAQYTCARRADALYALAMREGADFFLRAVPYIGKD